MTTQDNNEAESAAAYVCPAGCGCLWRDNHDGTMSLFDGEQKSCAVCENLPLSGLKPMAIADHLFIAQRGDGIWVVCVEKVHKTEDEARQACRRWMRAYNATASASQSSTAGADTSYGDAGKRYADHVARQRQESPSAAAVDAMLKDALIHGTGMHIAKPDGSAEHVSPEKFRAAVAEGVDTEELQNLLDQFVDGEYHDVLLTHIETVYGAQQREAGRREERAKFKNFHRQLCERFGYMHDEIDWQRDQVSLIEFLARRIVVDAAAESAGWKRAELDVRSLKEQSQAWFAVCGVLSELRPNWQFEQADSARNCKEAAVAAIRSLAR